MIKNTTKFPFTLIALIVGTMVAAGAGIASAIVSEGYFQSIVISLITETITIGISLLILIIELRNMMIGWMQEYQIQFKASSKVIEVNERTLYDKYKACVSQLEKISKGSYKIESLDKLYSDDIHSIDTMREPSTLSSTCPVFGNKHQAKIQLSNMDYVASIDAHARARKKKVVVRRVYIFSSTATFNDQLCQTHLINVAKEGIDVRFILLDDSRFSSAKKMPSDFIIFGTVKVSIGLIGANSKIVGGEVFYDSETIIKWDDEYKTLYRISEPFVPTDAC